MSATVERHDRLLVLRISGRLRKAELDAAQAVAVTGTVHVAPPSLLT